MENLSIRQNNSSDDNSVNPVYYSDSNNTVDTQSNSGKNFSGQRLDTVISDDFTILYHLDFYFECLTCFCNKV